MKLKSFISVLFLIIYLKSTEGQGKSKLSCHVCRAQLPQNPCPVQPCVPSNTNGVPPMKNIGKTKDGIGAGRSQDGYFKDVLLEKASPTNMMCIDRFVYNGKGIALVVDRGCGTNGGSYPPAKRCLDDGPKVSYCSCEETNCNERNMDVGKPFSTGASAISSSIFLIFGTAFLGAIFIFKN